MRDPLPFQVKFRRNRNFYVRLVSRTTFVFCFVFKRKLQDTKLQTTNFFFSFQTNQIIHERRQQKCTRHARWRHCRFWLDPPPPSPLNKWNTKNTRLHKKNDDARFVSVAAIGTKWPSWWSKRGLLPPRHLLLGMGLLKVCGTSKDVFLRKMSRRPTLDDRKVESNFLSLHRTARVPDGNIRRPVDQKVSIPPPTPPPPQKII